MSTMDSNTVTTGSVERAKALLRTWEAALEEKDVEAVLRLYRQDASLESPIVPGLLGQDDGVVHGHDGLRSFYKMIFARTGSLHLEEHPTPLTDGSTLIWRYQRTVPGGHDVDMTEVLEIEGDLITRHCIYWSWRGFAAAGTDQP